MGSAARLTRQRAVVLATALIVTAWGGAGLYEGLNSGFSGGLDDPQYRVPGVCRGSLADRWRFKAGDQVISVDGHPVETLGMVHPALYYSTGNVTSLLILVYVVLTLAAIAHTVVKAPRAELRASGMTWILSGFLAAIVGISAQTILAADLPAWAEALVMAAVPLPMALAVKRHAMLYPARATEVSTSSS